MCSQTRRDRAGRPARVGRQALLRPQRGRPRRRDRSLGAKRVYETARPISMIRYMGSSGTVQRSGGPSYDPKGLPLVPGLVEVVTPESSAPGPCHAALADHVGEIAVRAWQGPPEDPAKRAGWAGSRLAWMPYQRPTSSRSAFAGYVSGHSTFSRAAAEVLTGFTGARTSQAVCSRPVSRAAASTSSGDRARSCCRRPRTTTPPTRRASRASSAGSTSPRTTSPDADRSVCGREGADTGTALLRRLGTPLSAKRGLTQRELNWDIAGASTARAWAATYPRALERIGGIQAQYAPSMYIGLWSRLEASNGTR